MGLPSNEIEFNVGAGGLGVPEPPTDLVPFMIDNRIFIELVNPTSGGPSEGSVIEVGTASGLSDIATLPVMVEGRTSADARPRGFFTFAPVPSGVYFIRARARNRAGISARPRSGCWWSAACRRHPKRPAISVAAPTPTAP